MKKFLFLLVLTVLSACGSEDSIDESTFYVGFTPSPYAMVSDPDKQEKYISELLKARTKRKVKFVINFVLRDHDDLWEEIESPTGVAIAWRDSGFI